MNKFWEPVLHPDFFVPLTQEELGMLCSALESDANNIEYTQTWNKEEPPKLRALAEKLLKYMVEI